MKIITFYDIMRLYNLRSELRFFDFELPYYVVKYEDVRFNSDFKVAESSVHYLDLCDIVVTEKQITKKNSSNCYSNFIDFLQSIDNFCILENDFYNFLDALVNQNSKLERPKIEGSKVLGELKQCILSKLPFELLDFKKRTYNLLKSFDKDIKQEFNDDSFVSICDVLFGLDPKNTNGVSIK